MTAPQRRGKIESKGGETKDVPFRRPEKMSLTLNQKPSAKRSALSVDETSNNQPLA
jgi:hypothetical protein